MKKLEAQDMSSARNAVMKDVDEKHLLLNMELLSASMELGPDVWMDNETPRTLVELRMPHTLVTKIKLLTDAENQARERDGKEQIVGLRAEVETNFITSLIVNGIEAQMTSVLQEMIRRKGRGRS